jgi:predicted Rdx family selenoprotein
VAAELRKEPGLDVQLVDGDKGEFSVLVDGRKVAEKRGDTFPSPEEIKAAVRNAGRQAAGAAG